MRQGPGPMWKPAGDNQISSGQFYHRKLLRHHPKPIPTNPQNRCGGRSDIVRSNCTASFRMDASNLKELYLPDMDHDVFGLKWWGGGVGCLQHGD